ncbi:nucleotide exchange factor GrpE [Rhodococcus sp. 06-1477-1B]|uniref:nucleotide exchange factor GrpE n=1 Tax=Rhodococcus sp. 06-1474-1B TaxID=2022499 RepID=UPI000B9A55B8|nr:nucleotide exchange factor GrpE [Rhodococcus sp. 06-1474-1B]OZD48290.1 nucleotide exchange factor GrpE [Rhodococcus sp. 06-1474-1B]OZD52821.1 nucleotide exchange factor GrpE [Rhodococcus sp. 06-1477-1B]
MTSGNSEQEPVTFVDKRKIDPETGEVREGDAVPEPLAGTGTAPQPGSVDEGTGEIVVEAEDTEDPRDTQVAELTADLQRVSAEYANYRRRTDREKQTGAENAKASVVSQLLPVLDDLERARQHGDLETGPLKSVADKLAGVFSNIGLSTFGAEGDAFDPAIHEAVSHEGDGSNPVVGTLMRPGYKLGERVLRTAMVGVVDSASEGMATEESDAPASDEQ